MGFEIFYVALLSIAFTAYEPAPDRVRTIYGRIIKENRITNIPHLRVVYSGEHTASYDRLTDTVTINKVWASTLNKHELAWVLGHEIAHKFHPSIFSHRGEYLADKYSIHYIESAAYKCEKGIKLVLRFGEETNYHPSGKDRYQAMKPVCDKFGENNE